MEDKLSVKEEFSLKGETSISRFACPWVFQFVLKCRESAVWKMSAFTKCLIAVACVF